MHTPTQTQTQTPGAQAQRRPWLEIWLLGGVQTRFGPMPTWLIIKGKTYEIKEQLKKIVYETTGKKLLWDDVDREWVAKDIDKEKGLEAVRRIVLELNLGEEDVDLSHVFNYNQRKAFWAEIMEIRKQKQGGV